VDGHGQPGGTGMVGEGSATSTAARSYLLRYNALHQRRHRYVATHSHIAGSSNVMADDASRRWDLTDAKLLSQFDLLYSQALPWQMRPLPSSTNSDLIGALFKQRRRSVSPTDAPSRRLVLGPLVVFLPQPRCGHRRFARRPYPPLPNLRSTPPLGHPCPRPWTRQVSFRGRYRPRRGPDVCRPGGRGPSPEPTWTN
jgi:hypothetical protein